VRGDAQRRKYAAVPEKPREDFPEVLRIVERPGLGDLENHRASEQVVKARIVPGKPLGFGWLRYAMPKILPDPPPPLYVSGSRHVGGFEPPVEKLEDPGYRVLSPDAIRVGLPRRCERRKNFLLRLRLHRRETPPLHDWAQGRDPSAEDRWITFLDSQKDVVP
jgi:hypothetical protein